MLKRVVHLSVASLIPMLALACAAGADDGGATFGTYTTAQQTTFNDDMTDMEESESGEMGDGDGEPTGDGDPTTTGDGDGDPTTTGDGDGDPTTTGDGDPTTTGDGDGEPGPVCGDGNVDPGETCDGNNFDGETCQSLGFDQGTLSCIACAIDTSNCSNNGGNGQPADGLYSMCLVPEDCPGLDGCATVTMNGQVDPYDGYCTNFCASDAECTANLGGTAVPQCNNAADPYCELDCAGGKTCPNGMTCVAIQGGTYVCY
jgi:hypothetical protein